MSRIFKITLCINLILFIMAPKYTFALSDLNISMNCDNSEPTPGEEFTISFSVNSDEPINLSVYTIKIHFDSSKLLYKGLYADIGTDDFRSYVSGDTLNLLYCTTETGIDINKNTNLTIFEINFKVLSSANIGTTTISATINGVANYDVEEIPCSEISPIDVNISSVDNGNCDLSSLDAEGYSLTPSFSPDITNYYVEVPYSKSTLEITAIPVDEDASVKVSRKTLKSAGTQTDIKITVTSYNKKSRKVYTVTVNRLSKETPEKLSLSVNGNADIHSKIDENIDTNDFTSDNNNDIKENINKDSFIENTKKLSSPLVVKENGFNPIMFALVSIALIVTCTLIIKHKKSS